MKQTGYNSSRLNSQEEESKVLVEKWLRANAQDLSRFYSSTAASLSWVTNKMLCPELEEKLKAASEALERATSGNLVKFCTQYLALLAEYRDELYRLQGTPGINQQAVSSLSSEEIDLNRKEARLAIEHTTRERNKAAALLRSLLTISGYEAVEILNRQRYNGHDNWMLNAGGVRPSSGSNGDEKMTIQEAVDTASLLRREEYVAQHAASRNVSGLTPAA